MAQITENTYESHKRDLGLAAKFKVLGASLNFSSFDEKRREYFQLNKLNLEEYKAITLRTRTLDSKAYDLIKDCINLVASTAEGFRYVTVIDNRQKASVQFFWNPSGDSRTLKITDSTLENAEASGTSAPKGRLYPKVRWYNLFSKTPTLERASPVILLQRENVCEPIRISITTDPPVRTLPISIPPVHRPAIDLQCTTKYEDKNPASGRPYHKRDTFDLVARLEGPLGYGCPDCKKWTVRFDAPGPVTNVSCANTNNHTHIEACQTDGASVTAFGFLNAGPANLHVDYDYRIGIQDCKFPEPPKGAKADAC